MSLSCVSKYQSEEQKELRRVKQEERRKIKEARHISKEIGRQLSNAHKREMSCLKLLLLGTGESGKSTILKQMKIIHIDGYTDEEKVEYIPNIKRNLRDAMIAIVAAMETIEIDFEVADNAEKSRYLISEALAEEYEYPPEFFNIINDLWRDRGVHEAFNRSNEYQLIDSAKYFLDRTDIICQSCYVPTIQDILRCRKMTDAISEMNFEIRDGRRSKVRFKVFDVGGQRGERKKWIQLFDKVTSILFLADCSSFDQTLREDRSKNRLVDAIEVFQQAWMNKYLQAVPIIVFINKIDILDEKIRSGRSLDIMIDSVLHRAQGEQSRDASSHDVGRETARQSNGFTRRRNSEKLAVRRKSSHHHHFASIISFFVNKPFEDYQPTADEKKEFLYSYPIDDDGRTANSMKRSSNKFRPDQSKSGHKKKEKEWSRDLPEVDPETIRTACYVKNLFYDMTKQRVVAHDGTVQRRKCLFYYTCAVNTDNIQKVLEGCRAFLMEEHLERFGIL